MPGKLDNSDAARRLTRTLRRAPARDRKSQAPRMADKQRRNRHPAKKRLPQRRSGGSWKKGQSGNPYGRPRSGHALAEVLSAYLEDAHGRSAVSRKWHLIDKLFKMATAREASVSAARLLLERGMDLELEQRVRQLEERLAEVLKLVRGTAA